MRLRKDRPRARSPAIRESEERAAAAADKARSIAFHLHTTPPTYFTVVAAEQARATAEAVADRATVEDAERLELLKGAAQQADAEEAVIQWLVDSRRSHDARILLAPY